MTIFLQVIAVLLLVLGNAFFVAAEYALVTAKRARLMELAHAGNLRARIALRIMDSPVRFIGTVQLGITAFSIALGAVGEPLVEHWLDEPLSQGVAFILAFAFVTYLHVTLGELVPKAIALTKNEQTALWVALPVEGVFLVTYPARLVPPGLGECVHQALRHRARARRRRRTLGGGHSPDRRAGRRVGGRGAS